VAGRITPNLAEGHIKHRKQMAVKQTKSMREGRTSNRGSLPNGPQKSGRIMPITALDWIVPSTIFLCGLAFIGIRKLEFPTARWGYALCCMAMGYGLMLFETERFTPFKQILEDSFILLGVILAARALSSRLDLKNSLAFEATVVGLEAIMVAVALVMFESVRVETVAVAACCALVLWRTSLPFSYRARQRADLILAAIFLLLSALLTAQSLLFVVVPDVDPAVGAWRSSIWGELVQYTGLVGSVSIVFCVMVATAEDATEKYRTAAETDPLTNLLNRRGLETLLASRPGERFRTQPTAIILADIDYFKTINDRFGHAFGDEVITRFGALLKAQSGHSGYAVRMGGEEFLILLPAVTLKEAVAVAERIRCTFIDMRPLSTGLVAEPFTASFGVSRLAPQRESIAEAIARADSLLYSAKRSGRNCIVSQEDNVSAGAPPMMEATMNRSGSIAAQPVPAHSA